MEYIYVIIVVAVILIGWYMTTAKEHARSGRRHKPKTAEEQAIAAANVAHIKAQQRAILMRGQCRAAARSNHASIDQARDMCN